MSAALFDLALRIAARDQGQPVARLLHNPAPAREVAVAVAARRTGPVVHVQAQGPDGITHTGSGAQGLAAIARAAGCVGGDLGTGATAVVDTSATMRALGMVAAAHADPAQCAGIDVAAGSSLAGWWAERAAHPGTTAVADVLSITRQRHILGVVPGSDHAGVWRAALGVPAGLGGLHIWHQTVTGGPVLPGLDAVGDDDTWWLARHQDALTEGRTWDRRESLHLAAARLASRCDATDIYEAALLNDPLWRARGVHTGHVCHGETVVGAGHANRIVLRAGRLDTRLKTGTAVTGWAGDPMGAMPTDQFSGEVYATEVDGDALVVTIGGLGRTGYRPAAGETVTVLPTPPSMSTIRSRRSAVARLYKRRHSWLSQGTTPTAARRAVPLSVMIAAADDAEPTER